MPRDLSHLFSNSKEPKSQSNQSSKSPSNLSITETLSAYEEYSMSQFDPNSYLDSQTTEQSTRRPPLPAGREFVGEIKEIKVSAWDTSKKNPENPKSGIRFDIAIEFDLSADPGLVQAQGTSKVTIVDGVIPDLTENGSIDYAPGKSGKLRRYREALGLNEPGSIFAPRMMQGRMIRAKIKHDPYDGEIYDKIDSVSKP